MKRLIFSIGLVMIVLIVNGQSITELRTKKSNAEKQIKYVSSLLQEAQKNEQQSLSRLKLLKSQIEYRNQLIEDLNAGIEVVNRSISLNNEIIGMLNSDLEKLKKEYASMIRFAQKNHNSFDMLMFMFSAENINQAYKRWLYLRQYAKYRKNQGELIRLVAANLNENLKKLAEKKALKTDLLSDKLAENNLLVKQRGEENNVVQSLQKKQKELKSQIRDQQRIQDELNRKIQQMLEEEARKVTGKPGFALTPEQKLVSADFEKNRGRLPWPVEKGLITEHFGVHPHPVLKQIQVKSNGIDIRTTPGSKARAVFAGEVSRVFAISGGNMAVIIRHGSFLSVYSNLKEVLVKAGQKVALKQEIGTIYSDIADGNATVVKFQIWKENQKLNPEDWISRLK